MDQEKKQVTIGNQDKEQVTVGNQEKDQVTVGKQEKKQGTSDKQETARKKGKKRTLDKEKVAKGKALYKEKKKQEKLDAKQKKKAAKMPEKSDVDEKEKPQEKMKQQVQAKSGNKKGLWIVLALVAVLFAGGSVGGYYYYSEYEKEQAILQAEHDAVEAIIQTNAVDQLIKDKERHHKEELGLGSGEEPAKEFAELGKFLLEGILGRPPFVDLTPENTAEFTQIESCLINGETSKVEVTVTAEELPNSDDGYYYLMAEEVYEDSIEGKEPIAKTEKDILFTLSTNLNNGSADSHLYQKFSVAVKLDDKYVRVSKPQYITNPEAIAAHAPNFYNHKSKKGLLVDPGKLNNGSLEDLGVKHAAYNIMLSRILGNTTHGQYPTIGYTYHGKHYAFNGHVIDEYDHIFTTLSNKGIEITAIILNDRSAYSNALIHPNARGGGGQSHYYAFNNTDKDGIDAMAAVATFLANRYAGTGHGKVMNWVIGNEVNVRHYWNYIAQTDVKTYSQIYADSLRVFYNGIKSKNKNARVYISLDQVWHQNNSGKICYDGRDMLDEVNRYLKEEGNIDWCVAFHPYNYPLPATKAWADNKKVTNSVDTQIITMKNIDVLTNYLQNEVFLNSKGEVRRVSLSELGYTSSGGQEIQAASYAYCYKKAERNPYIDNVLLNRQTDHPVEVAEGLALGLDTSGGGHKMIYNVFKHIDGAQSDSVTKFARDLIGISSWSQLR